MLPHMKTKIKAADSTVQHLNDSTSEHPSQFVCSDFPIENRNSSAREMPARCDAELSRHGDSVPAYLTRAKFEKDETLDTRDSTLDCPSSAARRRGPRLSHRSAWDRLCLIDDAIRSGSFPSAKSLARKLGVNWRTIARDIDFLKRERRLPIQYDPRKYGYYYAKPVGDGAFPKTSAALTEAEIFVMCIAQKAMTQYRGTSFEKPIRAAFQKLIGQLDHRELHSIANLGDVISFRPFAPEECTDRRLRLVSRAVAQRRELCFRYRNWGDKRVIPRRLQPWHLTCSDNRWYLIGYEPAHNWVRTFALCRLKHPRLTKRRFPQPKKRFNAGEYFKHCLGVMRGKGQPGGKTWTVVIDLDRCGADLVRDRRWHPSQQLTHLPHGGARLTLTLSSLEEIERQVLGWGIHAVVVEPACLRHRLANITSELSAAYADALDSDCSGAERSGPEAETLSALGRGIKGEVLRSSCQFVKFVSPKSKS
jgi:predicted DNA-binding transcriptional regulator YafY